MRKALLVLLAALFLTGCGSADGGWDAAHISVEPETSHVIGFPIHRLTITNTGRVPIEIYWVLVNARSDCTAEPKVKLQVDESWSWAFGCGEILRATVHSSHGVATLKWASKEDTEARTQQAPTYAERLAKLVAGVLPSSLLWLVVGSEGSGRTLTLGR